jgi:DNA-binding CsgD family transcriptional regulator
MQDIFVFLLISCLSVGILTYILALAFFSRGKGALEKLFLAFLTFFTARMILDIVMFYVLPHLEAAGPALFFLLLVGRAAVIGIFIFACLFLHRLTGVLQAKRSRLIVYAASAAIFFFFVGEYVLSHLTRLPDMKVLYDFSPVDFLYYPMLAYPLSIFFIFSRRIRDIALKKLVRNFIVMLICFMPSLLFEDIFGSITIIFEFASRNPLPLKLFPVYYLMVYLFLLYHGFRNVIRERKAGRGAHAVTDEFIKRFAITAREKEIILLTAEGASNKQIGEKLFISAATVRNHLHNIFEKTGVANRVELLRLASS